jgi:hypothetical protein
MSQTSGITALSVEGLTGADTTQFLNFQYFVTCDNFHSSIFVTCDNYDPLISLLQERRRKGQM